MIIKRTVKIGELEVPYEAVVQGELNGEFAGIVVVHDPRYDGGRKRAFLLSEGREVPAHHVVVCRIAVK